MILRNDLLDDRSPPGVEVIQITEEAIPSCHIYMEAQIFTPDSKRFLVHRSASPHGNTGYTDPEHHYLVCDLENDGALSPVITELGANAPSVSPDGQWVYYLVDESIPGGGKVTLKRVGIDGADRQTIKVIDAPLEGTPYHLGEIYGLSTISSDGKRLVCLGRLGRGNVEMPAAAFIVFDLEAATADIVLQEPNWGNGHPQYCRSLDQEASHDLLIQQGNHRDGLYADIHLVRDDGTNFRNLPWGRTPEEFVQGHQCWRGRSNWVIGGVHGEDGNNWTYWELIESLPVPHTGHLGAESPGAVRNRLSRNCADPTYGHFATDIEGKRLITDAKIRGDDGFCIARFLCLADLGEPGKDAFSGFHYLLNPKVRSLGKLDVHPFGSLHLHPFLSPDGTMGFFNSDEGDGVVQAYMIRGLENV